MALHIAVAKKDQRVVRLLLKRADVFAADEMVSRMCLPRVVRVGDDPRKAMRPRRRPPPSTEANGRTATPAAISGNVEVLRTLLRMGNSKSALSGGGSIKHGGKGRRSGRRLDSSFGTHSGWEPFPPPHTTGTRLLSKSRRRGANALPGVAETVLGLAERGDHHACAEVIRSTLQYRMHRV